MLQVNAEKLQDVQQKLEGFLAQEKEQKERAQRCFVSYLRSTYLMKNKEVFDVFQLQTEEYAQSLGLAVAPRVRFLSKALLQKAEKTEQRVEEQSEDEEELRSFKAQLKGTEQESSGAEDGSDDEQSGDEKQADGSQGQLQSAEDEDDLRDVDLLTVKRKDVFNLTGKQESLEEPDGQSSKRKTSKETKYKEAKKVLKKNFQVNTKVIFNEEEEAVQLWPPVQRTVKEDDEEEDEVSGINVEKARERLKQEDQEFDKPEYRRKVKAKHREKRMKAKAARRKKQNSDEEEEDEVVAYLANHSEEEFDPNSLPDPDKLHSEEDEAAGGGSTKRQRSSDSSEDEDEGEEQTGTAFRRKKKTRPQTGEADGDMVLDTGLSLAEDEELVLHLLRGSR